MANGGQDSLWNLSTPYTWFISWLSFFFFKFLQQLKDEIAEVTAEMESLDNTGEDR